MKIQFKDGYIKVGNSMFLYHWDYEFYLDYFFKISYSSYRSLVWYRLIYLRQASKKNTFGLFSSCFVFAADNMSFIRTTPPSGHAKDVWFPWLLIKQMNLSTFSFSEHNFTLLRISSLFKSVKLLTSYPYSGKSWRIASEIYINNV